MESTTDILQKELDLIAKDLKSKHRELGMRSSGKWEDSVEVRVDRLKGTIYAEDYTQQLATGREPGKFPPIRAIEQWIVDKGLTPLEENLTISSLAFLIARKISREGTEYFKQGGTDLIESVVTPARIQSIIDKVSEFYISSFVTDLNGVLEDLAA